MSRTIILAFAFTLVLGCGSNESATVQTDPDILQKAEDAQKAAAQGERKAKPQPK
jgi:hypothetical protein